MPHPTTATPCPPAAADLLAACRAALPILEAAASEDQWPAADAAFAAVRAAVAKAEEDIARRVLDQHDGPRSTP